ncbi:ATP-binding protein [Vibrio brasiliensis]|uniref:ATP-binding protein n=1 Tax=Vibrio brasiliensis TaxID=170652 RepID=UPI001EFD7AC6|nr:ATP-binding protein [Vibrio brasiliensis]MCG9649062.1 ATP-binding protein [Vibrio brasiliensis]
MLVPDSDYREETIESYRIASEPEAMSAVIAVYSLAQNQALSATEVSEMSTSVSELAMNIVKYAQQGVITVSHIEDLTNSREGIKVVAKDNGPGIENIAHALEEHYSTGSSLGLGLPGVRRMVDEFYIESQLGSGTRVTIIKWKS